MMERNRPPSSDVLRFFAGLLVVCTRFNVVLSELDFLLSVLCGMLCCPSLAIFFY